MSESIRKLRELNGKILDELNQNHKEIENTVKKIAQLTEELEILKVEKDRLAERHNTNWNIIQLVEKHYPRDNFKCNCDT